MEKAEPNPNNLIKSENTINVKSKYPNNKPFVQANYPRALLEIEQFYSIKNLMPSKEDVNLNQHTFCDNILCDYQVTHGDKKNNTKKLKESIKCLNIRLAKYKKYAEIYGTDDYTADLTSRIQRKITKKKTEEEDMIGHRTAIYLCIAYMKRCINALLYRARITSVFIHNLTEVFKSINTDLQENKDFPIHLHLDIKRIDNVGREISKDMRNNTAEFQARKNTVKKEKLAKNRQKTASAVKAASKAKGFSALANSSNNEGGGYRTTRRRRN